MATYLITGGAGFIGSHLAANLASHGHAVRVLDNLATGKMENLRAAGQGLGQLDFIKGDITDRELCLEVLGGPNSGSRSLPISSLRTATNSSRSWDLPPATLNTRPGASGAVQAARLAATTSSI